MNSVQWWFYLLGAIFFIANLLLIIVLAYAVFKLIPTIQSISKRVDSIATKVDGIADTSHQTLLSLGERSRSVSGNLDVLSTLVKGQAEKHLPLVMAVVTGFKILGAVRDFRAGGKKPELPAPKKKGK